MFRSRFLLGAAPLGLMLLGTSALAASAAAPGFVARGVLAHGQKLGPVDAAQPLTVTVWLKLHNADELAARVNALYTPGSASFHQWLTPAELKPYLPTAAETEAIRAELVAHGLSVSRGDASGLYLRATGKAAQVQAALGTGTLTRYAVKGGVSYVSAAEPKLGGPAGALVAAVGGLNAGKPHPAMVRAVNPATGKPFAGVAVRAGNGQPHPAGQYFASYCFGAPETSTFTGSAVTYDGKPTTLTVTGLSYGGDPNVTAQGELPPCGYSVAQVQSLYGMGVSYGRGFTGTGQTVVLVEAGNNAQALPDANVFSSIEGLPALTSENYIELNPFKVTPTAFSLGTDVEADLDVEWAHAIAPGAKITVIDTFGDYDDLQGGLLYAVENHLGNVISLSFESAEEETGQLVESVFGEIAELAAGEGISLEVASGDEGDYTTQEVNASVNALAASPFDTAVGGTSVALDPQTNAVYTAGWGNNADFLSLSPVYVVDPPDLFQNFIGGSGGGASSFFAKPAYQAKLPGTGRMLPDVSALADPFTGAEIVLADGSGNTSISTVGGTSLASPIFAGMWAVLDGYAGASLGNAAPYVAAAGGTKLLTDVVAQDAPAKVSLTLVDSLGSHFYSEEYLAAPLYNTTAYLSAQWQFAPSEYQVLTFGTDTGLQAGPGWDPVTGWGTPNFAALFSTLP